MRTFRIPAGATVLAAFMAGCSPGATGSSEDGAGSGGTAGNPTCSVSWSCTVNLGDAGLGGPLQLCVDDLNPGDTYESVEQWCTSNGYTTGTISPSPCSSESTVGEPCLNTSLNRVAVWYQQSQDRDSQVQADCTGPDLTYGPVACLGLTGDGSDGGAPPCLTEGSECTAGGTLCCAPAICDLIESSVYFETCL